MVIYGAVASDEDSRSRTIDTHYRHKRAQHAVWVLFSEAFEEELHMACRVCTGSLIVLILVTIFVDIVQSDPNLLNNWDEAFRLIDKVACIIFTVEYILRLWSCVAADEHSRLKPLTARWRFAQRPLSVLDLVNLIVFWLSTVGNFSMVGFLSALRSLRMLRLFAVFKFERYAKSFDLLARVFTSKSQELAIASFISAMLLLMCSSVMYISETGHDPAFDSIPSSVLATMPAMLGGGYNTGTTEILASVGSVASLLIPFIGVSLLAMPTAILGAGFVENVSHTHEESKSLAATVPSVPSSVDQLPPSDSHDLRLTRLEDATARIEAKLDRVLVALLESERS